tara:strand:+ start:2150 stop:3280 length:1131 start_codon:yes stop_codon:yes gene_type:complete
MKFNLLYHIFFLNLIFSLLVPFVSHTNDLKYIFKSGSEGYNTFRIPSIITTDSGVILAFAEGRKNSSSDSGDIDLVLKRSTDGGKTWSDLIVIRDDSTNVCGNPSPVIDRKTGKIFLLSTWNRGDDTESKIINMTSVDTRRVYVMNSIDEGLSWSKPIEITDKVKKPNWTWYATGPVHGIQVREGSKKGRMIIPCDHIEANTKKYYSHVIYSDDGGSSWNIGGRTPQDQVNECSVAEIGKGKLILNMRNYDRTQMNRKISISNDYGESWGDIYDDKALVEPICQASILRYSFRGSGRNDLLFINPADKNKRLNMTLRLSNDLGRTWTRKFLIHEGPSAYSDITKLRNGNVGCLFEAGENSPYEGIAYEEVDVRDIN